LRIAQAGALLDAAQADRADARRQLRAGLAVVYWRLKAAETALQLAEADRQGYQRLVDGVAAGDWPTATFPGPTSPGSKRSRRACRPKADLLQTQRRDLQTELARGIAEESRAAELATVDDWRAADG
jgi:cobalt-zinc-cadmium efflux system outer membrane protein